ncbi:DUF6404 family protein [Dryocola sp. BD613]|uniref:DUF6404 family protein n=1 Tax=Dryocola sp. BD613 TaxID=3133272 RepID=UPI003F5063E1
MDFEAKKQRALFLLAQTGIWKSNYAPPFVRLLWRFRFNCPPPHFLPYYVVFLDYAFYFGLAWGAIMWLLQWHTGSTDLMMALLQMLSAGVLFGFFMAGYYAFGRRYYRLPKWKDV